MLTFWNWQKQEWPNFKLDNSLLVNLEQEFLQNSGFIKGLMAHVSDEEKTLLTVDALSEEAVKTSEIEGEYLNRETLQSSIRRNFGLKTDKHKISRAEQGIADIMTDVYQTYATPLTHNLLFGWHAKLLTDSMGVKDIGKYRTHSDPMRVVSGALHKPKIHFEAPPSSRVPMEMDSYVDWFNDSVPGGTKALPPLARAGIAHLYFESIHPFEDGNGRIGRALILKALSQNTGNPTILALSHVIQQNKKAYYEALERNSKGLDITSWILYFAKTILQTQHYTQRLINFVIQKSKFYHRIQGQLNQRQQKAIDRILKDGPDSFPLGLTAEKYIRITGTSRATATRDLQDLVDKFVFIRSGERKATRYRLNFSTNLSV